MCLRVGGAGAGDAEHRQARQGLQRKAVLGMEMWGVKIPGVRGFPDSPKLGSSVSPARADCSTGALALARLPGPWPLCAENLVLSSLVAASWRSRVFAPLLFLVRQIIVCSSILVCLAERWNLSGSCCQVLERLLSSIRVIGHEWGIQGTALMGYHQSQRLFDTQLVIQPGERLGEEEGH